MRRVGKQWWADAWPCSSGWRAVGRTFPHISTIVDTQKLVLGGTKNKLVLLIPLGSVHVSQISIVGCYLMGPPPLPAPGKVEDVFVFLLPIYISSPQYYNRWTIGHGRTRVPRAHEIYLKTISIRAHSGKDVRSLGKGWRSSMSSAIPLFSGHVEEM